MKSWSQTLKIVLTVLPFISLVILSLVTAGFMLLRNPEKQLEKARQQQYQQEILETTPYTNTKDGYTLEFPSNNPEIVKINCTNEGFLMSTYSLIQENIDLGHGFEYDEQGYDLPACARDALYTIEIRASETPFIIDYPNTIESPIVIDEVEGKKYISKGTLETDFYSQDIVLYKNGKYYHLHLGKEKFIPIFDQILSTFKFINTQTTTPTTTPVMKACQMDARICPDGSSVGRTGPNCEFEECPPFSNN